jgi:hypothetical protein
MSGQAKGSKGKLLYDSEDTFKTTPVAPDAHVLEFVSESLRMSRNLIDSKSIRGSRNPKAPSRGNKEVTGDVSIELCPYIGKVLFHVLGTVSTVGTSPYTHTFKINDLPAGLMVEKQFTDLSTPEYFQYNGCKVNSFKLSVKPEGFLDTTLSLMGAVETVTTSSFDATPVDYTTSSVGQGFDGFEASIQEGGVAIATVTGMDMTIENGLDGSIYVIGGSGERRYLPEGTVKVSGTLTSLFEDMTLYNKARNNTETSLKAIFQKGTGDGSANNEYMSIEMQELVYQPQAPVISGPTGVLVELPFVAYYSDGTNASAMQIVLKNTQTAGSVT